MLHQLLDITLIIVILLISTFTFLVSYICYHAKGRVWLYAIAAIVSLMAFPMLAGIGLLIIKIY
jgi:hypothetical protein